MSAPPSDPYGYCETLVREEDRDAWLASLFAPSSLRPYLHALDAFRIEIGRVRGRVTQPLAGEIRLQWWYDAVVGEARGDAHANPVAAALTDTIDRNALPRDLLLEAIEAHRTALYGEPVPTVAALEHMLDATAGSAVRLASMVLAGPPGDVRPAAFHAGSALGLYALLRQFSSDAQRGWAAIPSELLQRHGAGQADLTTARATSAILAALADLRALARGHLAALRASRGSVPEAAVPAYLRLALVEPTLRLLDRPGLDPFGPPPELASWRRQWSLWRASRKRGIAA